MPAVGTLYEISLTQTIEGTKYKSLHVLADAHLLALDRHPKFAIGEFEVPAFVAEKIEADMERRAGALVAGRQWMVRTVPLPELGFEPCVDCPPPL